MIILASTSPRRREVLNFFSIPFQPDEPNFDENSIPFNGDPKQYVMDLSRGKALSLKDKYPNQAVLAADTIVYFENNVLGKPKDHAHAFEILKKLQGTWHHVYTGITIVKDNQIISDFDETKILFKDCSDQEIQKYLANISCLDKAGAYAIQMAGNIMVERLEGCFYNSLGLPINALERSLKLFGISLWDYLKGDA